MVRALLRIAFAVPLLTVGLGAASAAAHTGPAKPLCAQAADTNHVGIVVEHGNGTVVTQCVGFDTPTITALAVLQAAAAQDSSFAYATESYPGLGEAVCQIGNEPQHYTQCLPSSGSYWVFFTAASNEQWASAAHGISATTVSNGDYVGFRYDPLTGGDPPPASPPNVCPPPPTATPKPTAQATATPVVTAAPGPTTHAAAPTPSAAVAAGATGGSTPAASNSPTPADGVLGVSTPQGSPVPALGVATKAVIDSPFNPALVIAVVAVAALVGLLGIQGLRRRRQ